MSATGSWNISIKTPMGVNEAVLDLQVNEDRVSGSLRGPKESSELFDGKTEGDTVKWSVKVTKPGPMTLKFTAQVSGDTISGGAKSMFGTAPFTGTRAA